MAERRGVGLGVRFEGRLIRQVLYSEDALNGRIIPIVLDTADKCHVPPELRDTTLYDVRPDSRHLGYDALLRRLTAQPVAALPPLGAPTPLLASQTPSLASILCVLQHVPAPFPIDILCQVTGMTRQSLLLAADQDPGPPILNRRDDDLLTTTYYRPVHPLPRSTDELLSQALDALLAHIAQRGPLATTRDEIRAALVLARTHGVRSDVVARVFDVTQKPLKRLGDKRLVWLAATLSLTAARRANRHRQDAEAEAVALICGQSWVLQRVNKLEDAEAKALESLHLGEDLKWHLNTAFCWKCLGRLSRLRAEATSDATLRATLLEQSERYLRDAIAKFTTLDDPNREEEVGDCWSLLGRTLFLANRPQEARAAARTAESQLGGSTGKDYLDLQILHGDLCASTDPELADDFYSAVIRHCATEDAQYSEIRARALYSRARVRRAQRRTAHAKADFEAAAAVWRNLQDPAVYNADWGALTCTPNLPIDPALLESKTPVAAVRVRAIRDHNLQLGRVAGRPARRRAAVDDRYLTRLVERARTQAAIAEVEWVARVTQTVLV